MALTTADLDHLDEMIAGGILESETADGKRVKFASFADLLKRRSFVARILRGRRAPRVGYVSFVPESSCSASDGEGTE